MSMAKPRASRITRPKSADTAEVRSEVCEKIAGAELACELAHQVNNPLESLTNLIYLARQKAENPDLKNMLDEADAQLVRLAMIVRGILNLERSRSRPRPRADVA